MNVDPASSDQFGWQWVAAFALSVVATGYGFFRDIYRKIEGVRRSSERHMEMTRTAAEAAIESVRAAAKEGDDALWKTVDHEREISRLHRESIIARMGELPTKDDFKQMEARVMAALAGQERRQ